MHGPVDLSIATHLTCLTKLTYLRTGIGYDLPDPFTALTALTALRSLDITGDSLLLPYVAGLTLLTHLRLWRYCADGNWRPTLDLGPFTRLQGLAHLGMCFEDLAPHQLAVIASLPSQKSLKLELGRSRPSALVCAGSFVPLSRLTSLHLTCARFDVYPLSTVNLEGLLDLSLECSTSELGRAGVLVFARATGLTHLKLWDKGEDVPAEPVPLGQVLSRMSDLRALSLRATWSCTTSCFEAIGLLASLTLLTWEGKFVTNADVGACLGLSQLRRLSIRGTDPAPFHRITRQMLVAVAQLPELSTLFLGASFRIRPNILTSETKWGLEVTDAGYALINAKRHAKGWPPLALTLFSVR